MEDGQGWYQANEVGNGFDAKIFPALGYAAIVEAVAPMVVDAIETSGSNQVVRVRFPSGTRPGGSIASRMIGQAVNRLDRARYNQTPNVEQPNQDGQGSA